jgi:hypothetical protein
MDEFGSPISGGIRAVRRNISSSFFGAPRQAQADPVTTNLLQQQSLQLTSVSQQLQNISRQITSLDFSLQGVKENLALNEQLERQREAERQKRERILAEQGLREGKESQLENKIQQSLTSPLQRVGVKAQSVLGRLQNFFLILAGGWLTSTGIDLLQALSSGNVDKINELKTKFLSGLTVIAGTLTVLSLGIKNSLRILGLLAKNVARVAFGGLLRVGLKGVQVLLAGLVKKAAGLGIGFLGLGGLGQIISNIVSISVFNSLSDFFTKKVKQVVNFGKNIGRSIGLLPSATKKLPPSAGSVPKPSGGFFSGVRRTIRKVLPSKVPSGTVGAMRNPAKVGIRGLINKIPGKGAVGKLLTMMGLKGGAKVLARKLLGPLGTFVVNLARGDGIGKALASAAGYAAAAAATAKILAPMLALPIPGARILYGILVLAGGIAGEEAIRKLYDGILGIFGFGKKKDKDANKKKDKVKVDGSGTEFTDTNRTYTDEEIDLINSKNITNASEFESITPIKNNNLNAAQRISEMEDEGPEIITVPMGGGGGVQGGGAPQEKVSNSIPLINFDENNPHTLYTTSVTGAGI